MSAFGVDEEDEDTVAIERLARLSRHASDTIAAATGGEVGAPAAPAAPDGNPVPSAFAPPPAGPPRLVSLLLAMDGRYDAESGELLRSQSPMLVPNDYVFEAAAEHPGRFVAAFSVNPLRNDAIAEL